MRICIGCDHRGIDLKEQLKAFLEKEGCTVVDKGTSSEDSVDYPDFAREVASRVSLGTVQQGLLVLARTAMPGVLMLLQPGRAENMLMRMYWFWREVASMMRQPGRL